MLVLTRKLEQRIIIGDTNRITVTVLRVQGDQVSIGIEADRDTPIYREELLQQMELHTNNLCKVGLQEQT